MHIKFIAFSFLVFFAFILQGQDVKVKNGSFEGKVAQGNTPESFNLEHWNDCGIKKFPGQTPPDIHPNNFWENDITQKGINILPSEGDTYLGMVVRANNTYESVTQKLTEPLQSSKCYMMAIDLTRSEDYWSASSTNILIPPNETKYNFNNPIVLRIWGSNNPCYYSTNGERPQLLGESSPVSNTNWQTNIFNIEPVKEFKYITIEAFYKTPITKAYLGHILLDNMSDFIEVECNDSNAALSFYEEHVLSRPKPKPPLARKKPAKVDKNKPVKLESEVADVASDPTFNRPQKQTDNPPVAIAAQKKVADKTEEPKFIQELQKDKISLGQKIRIEELYFNADATTFKGNSLEVLEELAQFLLANDNVKVEIGGHTNGIPAHAYCDSLSTARAKVVRDHIVVRGVPGKNVEYKGYGKRQPIAPNSTKEGRKRNQRVEIKILSL